MNDLIGNKYLRKAGEAMIQNDIDKRVFIDDPDITATELSAGNVKCLYLQITENGTFNWLFKRKNSTINHYRVLGDANTMSLLDAESRALAEYEISEIQYKRDSKKQKPYGKFVQGVLPDESMIDLNLYKRACDYPAEYNSRLCNAATSGAIRSVKVISNPNASKGKLFLHINDSEDLIKSINVNKPEVIDYSSAITDLFADDLKIQLDNFNNNVNKLTETLGKITKLLEQSK